MRVYESDPEYHLTCYGKAAELKEQLEHWQMVEHKERLEAACNEAYQVVGQMLLEDHERSKHTFEDVTRMLDNLLAAVNNRPLPHSDILPWPKKL